MKNKKAIIYVLSVLATVVLLTGCPNIFGGSGSGNNNDSGGGARYSVTYEAGDADGGAVPTDDTEYGTNDTVTIEDNSGGLTRTGFVFAGWNTAQDGTGTEYDAGDSFTIDANTTLYAQWENTAHSVTYEAGDADGGTVPTDDTEYGTDETVTIEDNSEGLTRTGFVFAGWNTAQDGTGTEYNAGDSFTIDANTTLYAQWTNTAPSVSIDTPSKGEEVSKNDIVTFAATISDTEEPNSSLELVWRVDGGDTGTSNPISMNALSDIGLGEHTITLSVTDSGGLTTEESVTIEVLENVDSGITIEF